MSWKKFPAAIILVLALSAAASASITEIRRNFFNQTADLSATPIVSAPIGDASYLIAIYESVGSASATPTLRWTDENGVSQSQTGVFGYNGCQMTAFIRVKAGTQPTVETTGYSGTGTYTVYVSGLGFWSSGTQGQAGLSEVTGIAKDTTLVYYATHSISAILVAFSMTGIAEQTFTWWDENGERVFRVTRGAPLVTPMRIAGGTRVLAFDPLKAGVWYGLILFGAPAAGFGPFGDYESDLLDWTNATFPTLHTAFNPGTSGRNVVLLMSNIAEQPNHGSVDEQLLTSDQGLMPCGGAITASPSGEPATCVGPAIVKATSRSNSGPSTPPDRRGAPRPPTAPRSLFSSSEVDVFR
jgi:hypothetical protein